MNMISFVGLFCKRDLSFFKEPANPSHPIASSTGVCVYVYVYSGLHLWIFIIVCLFVFTYARAHIRISTKIKYRFSLLVCDGVAAVSRIDKTIGPYCKRAL